MGMTAAAGDLSRSGRHGHLAQVRVSDGEWSALREAMEILGLPSTSEALRNAIRLLHREAAEIAAAREIRAFYAGGEPPASVLDTVVTSEDLEAADRSEW